MANTAPIGSGQTTTGYNSSYTRRNTTSAYAISDSSNPMTNSSSENIYVRGERRNTPSYRMGSINHAAPTMYKKTSNTCTKCTKYTIALCSVAIFLFGVVLLSVGLWAYEHYSATRLVSFQKPILISVIVLGGLVTATSLLGCCGAFTETRLILIVFSILLGLLVIAQLSLGVGSAVISTKVPEEADKIWDNIDNVTRNWTQRTWDCCGFLNFTDDPVLPCPNVTNLTPCYPALKQTLSLIVATVEIGSFIIGSIEGVVVIITAILLCLLCRPSGPEYQLLSGSSI